jgi:indolepyruvate ferredoxin oxidoreductase alpha subunit
MDIVYNKGITTVIIMDNRTTAMTGHQEHPGTGRTGKGEPTYAVDFEQIARAMGVTHVKRYDPRDLKASRKIIKEALEAEEPAVLIAEAPCVLLREERKKTAKRPKMTVDPELCKGQDCGLCHNLGCTALTWKDGKSYIDPLLCAGCGLCVQVCGFKAIS